MSNPLLRLSGESDQEDWEPYEAPVFSQIAAEQEALQATIQFEPDAGVSELEHLSAVACESLRESADLSHTAYCLESMAQFARRFQKQGGQFSAESAALFSMNTELLYSKAHKVKVPAVFSMESDRVTVSARALEEMQETSSGLFKYLKEKLVSAVKHIAEIIGFFNRNMVRLKYKMAGIEKKVHEIGQDAKPKFSQVKPESWCKYLCYSDTGFDTGLSKVISDVTGFIDDHMQMANNSVDKQMGWFKANAGEGADESVFDSFQYSPDDYKLPHMSEFHRSIGFSSTHGDNINYRTNELPGGKAFYVEANPTDQTGLEGMRCFQSVRFSFDDYNPSSWNMFQAKLSMIVGMGTAPWLLLVNPLLGAAALGAAAYSVYDSKYKEAAGGKVNIDDKLMFDVLTPKEMANTLTGIRKGISELQRWNILVLQKPWKNRELDDLVDTIMDDEYSTSALRSYCNALISYMSAVGAHVHAYTFKVFGAALNFIDKSCKQY